MALFKKVKKKKSSPAAAPEEPETEEEIKHIEEYDEDFDDDDDEEDEEVIEVKPKRRVEPKVTESKPNLQYREVPVCLSQAQINNIIIENNIMLKEIMTHLDD